MKFERLRPDEPQVDTSRTVVNLTKFELTDNQVAILRKGGNFAITPYSIPTEDIISNVEAAITSLPEPEAEEVRTEVSRILRKARAPKCNIKVCEKLAIRQLNNKEIVILPADKGSSTDIMEMDDYKSKVRSLLESDTYNKLAKDPTQKVLC